VERKKPRRAFPLTSHFPVFTILCKRPGIPWRGMTNLCKAIEERWFGKKSIRGVALHPVFIAEGKGGSPSWPRSGNPAGCPYDRICAPGMVGASGARPIMGVRPTPLQSKPSFCWLFTKSSGMAGKIIVPLGDWEKNPRLQAKTLVCLRYGKIP
jgi:hypothetical protein